MVFSTDSDLSYVYLQYKSEKVHGLFGLGWKNQEHTVIWDKDISDQDIWAKKILDRDI